jgi:hypothetical protein
MTPISSMEGTLATTTTTRATTTTRVRTAMRKISTSPLTTNTRNPSPPAILSPATSVQELRIGPRLRLITGAGLRRRIARCPSKRLSTPSTTRKISHLLPDLRKTPGKVLVLLVVVVAVVLLLDSLLLLFPTRMLPTLGR